MKILLINKFLFPNGGSETYIFQLGEYLIAQGHAVQYFGMEHENRCVGNQVNAYADNMDFHGGSKLAKLAYPFKTIYSKDARVKLRRVLEDFNPDVCHLNNFNYQLTPSIILEIVKWRKQSGHACKIIYTAHDYQLICPNHMMNIPWTHENCEKCVGGHFANCMMNKCIHGSRARSIIGMLEAELWNRVGVYRHLDVIICCSEFMKRKLDTNPVFREKTIVLHNFIDKPEDKPVDKKEYVLYFGRYSWEKGVRTLIEAAKRLPEIPFVFAGSGEYDWESDAVDNIQNVGFQTGATLDVLIRQATFSVCPSEWYENCPFSVMESQTRGTVVVGADIGGIPELIEEGKNGLLFESGNVDSLVDAIHRLWNDRSLLIQLQEECMKLNRDDVSTYTAQLLRIIE